MFLIFFWVFCQGPEIHETLQVSETVFQTRTQPAGCRTIDLKVRVFVDSFLSKTRFKEAMAFAKTLEAQDLLSRFAYFDGTRVREYEPGHLGKIKYRRMTNMFALDRDGTGDEAFSGMNYAARNMSRTDRNTLTLIEVLVAYQMVLPPDEVLVWVTQGTPRTRDTWKPNFAEQEAINHGQIGLVQSETLPLDTVIVRDYQSRFACPRIYLKDLSEGQRAASLAKLFPNRFAYLKRKGSWPFYRWYVGQLPAGVPVARAN